MAGIIARQYQDEDAAREHLEKLLWPDGPVCPHCGIISEAYKLDGETTRKAVTIPAFGEVADSLVWTPSQGPVQVQGLPEAVHGDGGNDLRRLPHPASQVATSGSPDVLKQEGHQRPSALA